MILALTFISGAGGVEAEPIREVRDLGINIVFLSHKDMQVEYKKWSADGAKVHGFYVRGIGTMYVPMPRDWSDKGAMRTIGHELMHFLYAHGYDWVTGEEMFIEWE